MWEGALVQVFTFAGLAAGLVAGLALVPRVAEVVRPHRLEPVVPLAVVLISLGTAAAVGERLGTRLSPRRGGGSAVNAAAGAAISAVSTLAVIWLVVGMLAAVPAPRALAAIHRSSIVQGLEVHLPPQPALFSRIGAFLSEAGLPPVFAEVEPSPAPSVAPVSPATVRQATETARTSVVKVIADGCGRRSTGSGFVARPGIVVTNAHVVAGGDDIVVVDVAGRDRRARLVLFDPLLDVAVLRAADLAASPVRMAGAVVPRGTPGAVLGFPGGGRFDARGAVVRDELHAVGRDIYSGSLVRRHVYQLQAEVSPGNSGGPFVLADGAVAGVVFSRSAVSDNIGYALTTPEILPLVDRAASRTAAVGTGRCVA